MKNRFLWVMIIALAIIDGIVLYMHHQYKENTKIVLNSQQNIINEHGTLSLQLPLVYQYCHASLDTINVEDIDENISSLNNVIDCDVIACRISEEFCESCNDYALDIFNKAIKNFDSKHVVFLISCKSHRNFRYNVNKQYKISDYKAYLVDDDLLPCDNEIGFPYYMVLGKDAKIKGFYMPSKMTPDMDLKNLNMLYHYCVATGQNTDNTKTYN